MNSARNSLFDLYVPGPGRAMNDCHTESFILATVSTDHGNTAITIWLKYWPYICILLLLPSRVQQTLIRTHIHTHQCSPK